MSHHGETSSSSFTRPSQMSSNTQNMPNSQSDVVGTTDACLQIVHKFQSRESLKPRASLLLQKTIPQESISEDAYESAYGAYLDMLDNFEAYRQGSSGQVGETCQRVKEDSPRNHDDGEHFRMEAQSSRSAKQPRSPSTDGEGDKYTNRTRLDFKALPWNGDPSTQDRSFAQLFPSLQKTNTLLKNFSRDIKQSRSSLLNCNRSLPQFPQSEWLNLLSGNAIDLDHVFSNIYTISCDVKESVEIGKQIEVLHGASKPAKTVKTHGDWVIAWDSLVDATLFVFEHRRLDSSCMGNISRDISLPYLSNSTPESSIMTELCKSEHHNDMILSYPACQSSLTCK